MSERRNDRDGRDGRDERSRDGNPTSGPEGSDFLDLEITQVLHGEAERLAREAVRDILREALRKRLRERLGTRLEALAHIAADALADEVETNLTIEALVRTQSEKKQGVEERLRRAMAGETHAPPSRPSTDLRPGKRRGPR